MVLFIVASIAMTCADEIVDRGSRFRCAAGCATTAVPGLGAAYQRPGSPGRGSRLLTEKKSQFENSVFNMDAVTHTQMAAVSCYG